MLAKYDKFSRLEMPKMTLCNPNDEPVVTSSGVKQVETIVITGSYAANGTLRLTLTAAGMAGNTKSFDINIGANTWTANSLGDNFRAMLLNSIDVISFFDISGSGATIVITAKKTALNDVTMNMSIQNTGAFTGFNNISNSQNTVIPSEYGNIIKYTRDETLNINFNAISELSFVTEKTDKNFVYDYYRMKRQVYVEDLGYFVITGVSEGIDENGKTVKNITASSCEIELNNFALPYIQKGTYKLYDPLDQDHSLLHFIMPSIPAWSLSDIDSTLAQTQRTFDDESGTIYGFFMNKLAETYECIVEYEILNRVITFKSKTVALNDTGIFLSKSNVATGVEYSENADEYANCISVKGGSDAVNIGLVNPVGNSVLYNFSYDISSGLMSEDLTDAIGEWKQAVEDVEDSYYALQLERAQKIDDLEVAGTDLLTKQTTYSAAVQTYDIARAGGNGVSEALQKLNTARAEYEAAGVIVNQINNSIIALSNSISAIHSSLQFNQFMSNDLITELSRCMQMATYSDENIIFTDIMTQAEKLGWMKTLYDKAKRLLNGGQIGGICEPRRQVTVNTQGFVFKEKFKDSADELEGGCLIAVEMPNGEAESYILQKFSVNYEEKSLNLTFGNRFRPSDPTGIFRDLYNGNSDMASIVASNYIQWGEQIAKVNELELERYRNLEINTNRVISSTTNRVTIDENGIVCKSTDPLTKEDEKYGLRIADGTILFTEYDEDADTYSGKMAVGRVIYEDGREDYGILGGSIVANTVTADKIVAGSVEKGRNLVKDGSFTNYGWLGSIGLHSVEKTGGFDEGSYFKGITDDASAEYSIKSSNRFMVTPNLDYRASFYYKATKKTGTIASCSNYNSTVPGTTKITSNAHGLSNGITKGVIISGTTDYNGIFDVTYINANSFYINKVFTSSQTGTWKYGWNAGISEIKMKVHWYSADAEASLLSTSVLGAVDGSAGWTRLNEAFVAPSNADFASVEMYVKGFAGEVDFDGIMLEQSPTLGDYSPYIGDLTARYTVINDDGVTIRNGKLRIKNEDEEDVLYGDDDGNLTLKGGVEASSGKIAGWDILPIYIRKGYRLSGESEDRYYSLHAPPSPVANNAALSIGGVYNPSTNSYAYNAPFLVRYDGSLRATGTLEIKGTNNKSVLYSVNNLGGVTADGMFWTDVNTNISTWDSNEDMSDDMEACVVYFVDGSEKSLLFLSDGSISALCNDKIDLYSGDDFIIATTDENKQIVFKMGSETVAYIQKSGTHIYTLYDGKGNVKLTLQGSNY